VLASAHKVCRGLGIDRATIQVHDSSDSNFCYSQTCDWEHSVDIESEGGASGSMKNRNTLCVTNRF